MCFSTKASVVSWTIALAASLYLFRRNEPNDRWIASFTITFSLIQIIESGLWATQTSGIQTDCKSKWCLLDDQNKMVLDGIDDDRKRKINSLLTKFILVALWLQPLVHSAAGYMTTQSKTLLAGTLVFFVTFLIAIIAVLKKSNGPSDEWKSEPGPNGHLIWYRPGASGMDFVKLLDGTPITSMMYMAGLLLPPLFMKPSGKGAVMTTFGITSFFVAKWTSNPNEFSSNWCYISVIYPLVAIVYPHAIKQISRVFEFC
jgi:hypothetical protein